MRRRKKPTIEYAPCKGCGTLLASMATNWYRENIEHMRFWCDGCITDDMRQQILSVQMAQKLLETAS